MDEHTRYLGRIKVEPPLNADEVALLTAVHRTRHAGLAACDLFEVDEHPEDADEGPLPPELGVATRAPGVRCPWTVCPQGCCLYVDGSEDVRVTELWLAQLIDDLLRPGAALRADLRARRHGLTFDHVLDGVVVGQTRPSDALVAIEVVGNALASRVLVPGALVPEPWRDGVREDELEARRLRLLQRRARYRDAVAEDLARARRARGQR